MLDHGLLDEKMGKFYEEVISDILDVVAEMKLSGDYDTDTLDEIVWRLS